MSWSVNSFQVSGDGLEDILGGLAPDEWLRVLVPRSHPVAEIFLERLHAAVIGTLQEITHDFGEESFDLIDP